jgi:23S rRNA pseudouridine2457 synthase
MIGIMTRERPQTPTILRFWKPNGVLTQFSDADGRPTLKDFLDVESDVYPVGRLDKDSEGLLLLTNDPRLTPRLLEPKFGHPRTYLVQVEHIPTEEALQKLRTGVSIKTGRTKPAEVRLLQNEPDLPPRDPPIRYRANVPTAWLEMTLTEGKNRQVRRMTGAISHPTLRLVRASIGPITLDSLAPGEAENLTEAEKSALYEMLNLRD